MIKSKQIVLILGIAIASLNIGCSVRNLTEVQEDVFHDIFQQQLKLDIRRMPPPPPPAGLKDSLQIDHDFFNDPRKMLVVVNDSIELPTITDDIEAVFKEDYNTVQNKFKKTEEPIKFQFKDYPFDRENIVVISKSMFERKKAYYKENFYLGGHLSFSGITFNKSKDKGVLILVARSGRWSRSVIVLYVEKNDEEWKETKSNTLSGS